MVALVETCVIIFFMRTLILAIFFYGTAFVCAQPISLGPPVTTDINGCVPLLKRLARGALSSVGMGLRPPILNGLRLPGFRGWDYISNNYVQSETHNKYGTVQMTAGGPTFKIKIEPDIFETPPEYRIRKTNYRALFPELENVDWVEFKFSQRSLVDSQGPIGDLEISFDTSKSKMVTEEEAFKLVRQIVDRIANPVPKKAH